MKFVVVFYEETFEYRKRQERRFLFYHASPLSQVWHFHLWFHLQWQSPSKKANYCPQNTFIVEQI